MRILKKMSVGELLNDSNEVLARERMKAIRGGGGDCYVYCKASAYGTWGIVQECADGYNICGDEGWSCAGC